MIRNLLVSTLLIFIIAAGCKEVSSFQEPLDLSQIAYHPNPVPIKVPKGFPQLPLVNKNPQTEEGIALGRKLFHDPILSADSTMSCASCHFAHLAMTDGKALSKGIDQKEGFRSAMSLVNVAFYNEGFFWDGRVKSLEEQALLPVEDSIELHNSWDQLVDKLRTHPEYPVYFRKAFGIDSVAQIDKYMAANAMAQFEKTLISANSRYDQIERGEEEYTPDEKAGYEIFFDDSKELPDGECGHCHNVPLMTTNEFLNNGITYAEKASDFPDLGRGGFTGSQFDNGKFRVPSLRNIALTAPYMHDGRFKTLEEVVDHYASGGHYSPSVSPLIKPLNLDETQKRQLIAFLNTLTDLKFVQETQQSEVY